MPRTNPRRRSKKPRSISENLQKLFSLFEPKDKVLITIDADPDAMASAMAAKRLLWHKVQSVTIGHFNEIVRFDNVTMVRLLKIPLVRLQDLNPGDFSKAILVDGQPHHHEAFSDFQYDAVIDHHPITMDTHNFELHARQEDVRAFRYLFSLANMNLLRKIEISDMSVRDLKYFQQALENKRVIKGKIFTHLPQVHSPDILVLIADFLMRCHEVGWTVASGIYNKNLVVILRNDGFRKNAGTWAIKAFGRLGSAGGHRAMARAEIPLANLDGHLRKSDQQNLGRFVVRQFTKSVER